MAVVDGLRRGYALSDRERELGLAGELRMMGEGGFWREFVVEGWRGGAGSGGWRWGSWGVGGDELFDLEEWPLERRT